MSENSLIVDDDVSSDSVSIQTISGGGTSHRRARRLHSIGVLLLPHRGQNSQSKSYKSFLHSLRVQNGMVAAEAKMKLCARLSLPESDVANYDLLRIDIDPNSKLSTRFLLHTLHDDEVLSEEEKCEGTGAGNKGECSQEGARHIYTRWFFKDSCSSPLTLSDGELSGQESSGDEDSYDSETAVQLYPLNSFGYDTVKAGWLLKRSSWDPNLWRKRWCELTESRLWVLSRKPDEDGIPKKQRRSFWLSLYYTTVDEGGSEQPKYCIKVMSKRKAYVFRAPNKDQQLSWMAALHKCICIAMDNDCIQAAESIICGEEYARCARMNEAAKANRLL